MALRINDDIRAEWDAIEFSISSSPTKRKPVRQSPTKPTKRSASKHQDAGSNRVATSKAIYRSPSPAAASQQQSDSAAVSQLTLDCITLEPQRPAILDDNVKSAVGQASRYAKGSPARIRSEPTVIENSEEESESSQSQDDQELSVDDSLQTLEKNRDDSNDDQDVSSQISGDSTDVDDGLQIPDNSDDEEVKADKERRRLAYQDSLRIIHDMDVVEGSALQYESQSHPSDLASPQINSPISLETIPHVSSQLRTSFRPGPQADFVVSSSTDPSQQSVDKKVSEVLVSRTQGTSSSGLVDSVPHVTSISTTQPACTSPLTDFGRRLIPNSSLVSIHPSSGKATSELRPISNEFQGQRKRMRTPPGSGFVSTSTASKKPRMAAEESTPTIQESPGLRHDYDENVEAEAADSIASSQTKALHKKHASVQLTPSPAVAERAAISVQDTPGHGSSQRGSQHHRQESNPIGNEYMPGNSVSQPEPVNSMSGISAPALEATERIGTETIEHPPASDGEEAEKEEPSANSQLSNLSEEGLDLSPLTIIFTLLESDYTSMIKTSAIYCSLMQLFIEFLTTYRNYTGSMKHFFTLCSWLLQNHGNEESIDGSDWDDFIRQHHEEYDAYAFRCLSKYKMPLAWDKWYSATSTARDVKQNVVSKDKLEGILKGKVQPQALCRGQSIPGHWTRFQRPVRSLAQVN